MYVPLGGNMKRRVTTADGIGGGASANGGSNSRPTWTQSAPVVMLRKIVNMAIVFTFVAVWHDQTMSLLAWGR
jgi:hypothetical protein